MGHNVDPDELVRASSLLRQRFEPSLAPEGEVILSGRPDAWRSAVETLERHGVAVAAFHDIRRKQPERPLIDRPLLRGVPRLNGRDLPVVFAGKPTKHWFNPSPPGPERCFWLTPPEHWQEVGRHTPRIWNEQRAQVEEVFGMLADEPSREVLASIVKARLEGDTGYHRVSPYPEYDHPVVRPLKGDIVLDAGAFDGDTALQYSRRVGRRGRVVALEPSASNFGRMVKRARKKRLRNLTPLQCGTWDDDAVLRFSDGAGPSSKLDEDGKVEVVVTAVDKLVRDHRLPRVDLLKLDVEGAEKRSLEGAKETLRRDRPILHVSIYHRFDDLFELPLMLRDWLPGYRWYMGHHSFYQMETDLYGIPVERWLRGRLYRAARRTAKKARARLGI